MNNEEYHERLAKRLKVINIVAVLSTILVFIGVAIDIILLTIIALLIVVIDSSFFLYIYLKIKKIPENHLK